MSSGIASGLPSGIASGIVSSMTPEEIEKPLADAQAALTAAAAEMTDPALASAISADADKVRENRLRRMAERQGLRYQVSRRRDPRAIDYGRIYLIDARANTLVTEFTPGTGTVPGTVLDQVEAWLTGNRE